MSLGWRPPVPGCCLSGCIYLYSELVDLGIIVGLAVHLTKLRYILSRHAHSIALGVLHDMAWHGTYSRDHPTFMTDGNHNNTLKRKTIVRSKMSSETLNIPPQSETPSSTSSHDRFALLVIVSVSLGLLRNTMEYRVKWQKDHLSVSRDGLPTLIQWLQYQTQYVLILVYAYRSRTMGSKTRIEYCHLLFNELHFYRMYAYGLIPFMIVSSVLESSSSTTYSNKPYTLVIIYAYVANGLLYEALFIYVEFTLIYTDLIACGFSRDALMEHFAQVNIESVLQAASADINSVFLAFKSDSSRPEEEPTQPISTTQGEEHVLQ
ncbi:MAG: hypothetical protein J3Q66DRAFT_10723 [Benniella sp.]|nr:MAG: hypothetical protein J3Q66DRAFT_10723 [Benniella sp.]